MTDESMNVLTRRIVVLGKTGAGKSSFANTIFGKTVFEVNHSPKSGTSECKAETTSVNGGSIMWIDTPGFFDTGRSEEEMKTEIVRCITECAPGPHAFLIVLKVEKFTVQEQDVIKKLRQYFSEEALKYAIVLFTHGDQLSEGETINEFVSQSEDLRDLVEKCGSRCHVIDNKYWKNNQQDEYRSNWVQVAQLLKTIDKMTEANKGGCYTNEMLQAVERQIQQEEVSSTNMSQEEITHKAKTSVFGKQLFKAVCVTTGALLGAFLGGAMKLMNEEGSTVALVVGVAIGTAAGMAAGVNATEGATAEAPTPSGTVFVTSAAQTAEEHQE